MNSLPLLNATRRIGAPVGWNHETDGICHTLEVFDQDGFMISAWTFTPAERARVAAGAPVFLRIQGSRHPVVSLTTGEVPA